MSKKCGFGTFLKGALLGATLGVLLAPKKGSETREELKQKLDELVQKLKDIDYVEVKDNLLQKVEELKEELKDLDKEKAINLAKEKATFIQKKAEEIIEIAKEKGTPIVANAAEEVKEKTILVLKDVLSRLEKEEEVESLPKKKTTKAKKVVEAE